MRILGKDPVTDLEVTLRDGRFGPYIQLGEGEKPKRSSLPKGMSPGSVTIWRRRSRCSPCRARWRSIPRAASRSSPASAATGLTSSTARPTPISTRTTTSSNIGANRAIDLIVAKESGAGGGRFGRGAAVPGRELGEHPGGGNLVVRAGKYGPYVNWGKVTRRCRRR